MDGGQRRPELMADQREEIVFHRLHLLVLIDLVLGRLVIAEDDLDPPPQLVVEVAQDRVGLLESTVSHLEGGQGLGEELGGLFGDARALGWGEQLQKDRYQGFLVERRHLEDAEVVGQGLPPDLVGLEKGVLAPFLQVALEGAGVATGQLLERRLHPGSAVKRATRTRASSVVLLHSPNTRSASA